VQVPVKNPFVYILTNKPRGTLYVGVTSDLVKRIWQHKNNVFEGFSSKYHLHTLVWFEQHASMEAAILREKQIKGGSRQKKIALIDTLNPQWLDLYERLL
jgi:putative endonuclease